MDNRYMYEVHTKRVGDVTIPLHIVEIHTRYLFSFAVFNTARDAANYIRTEKERHEKYGITMLYDGNNDIPMDNLLNLYLYENGQFFTKLENKQIYCKQIFH